MSFVASTFSSLLIAAEGSHEPETHSWILPETPEIIYGGIAFLAIVALMAKFKVHKLIGAAFSARTAKIQKELDDSAAARNTAQGEASQIRQAAGDIQAERGRLLAEAETQAAALLADGRVRLDTEVAELEARATADLAAAAGRGSDELHAEIARLSSAASERLLASVLDDATHNELIESFIAKVGAS